MSERDQSKCCLLIDLGLISKLWNGTSHLTQPYKIFESDEGVDKRYQKVRYIRYASFDDLNHKYRHWWKSMEKVIWNHHILVKNAPRFYGIGCYFSTTPGYSDNQYAYKVSDSMAGKTEIRQLLLWRVIIGCYDFGLISLEADQMRTLKKADLESSIDNLGDEVIADYFI